MSRPTCSTDEAGASSNEDRATHEQSPQAVSAVPVGIPSAGEIERIKARRYECFFADFEDKPWTPGQCASYAGSGSKALHLFRCKRKDGHGIGGLFCSQHAKAGGY